MATTRGTTRTGRPVPQDHKPKASRAEALRKEALTINDVPEDKMDEASQKLAVYVDLRTKLGEASIGVKSPLDWPYETGSKFEDGDVAAFVHGAVFDDDDQPAEYDDDGELVTEAVPSSASAFEALRPTHLDVLRFVDRWREAVGDAVGKLQASSS